MQLEITKILDKADTMTTRAILFGSIGTLVETSELQRLAFNQAFSEAGLDWNWSADAYQRLLAKSGGRGRIQDFAKQHGIKVDAQQLHQRKTEIFDAMMTKKGLLLRPGVADVIHYALDNNVHQEIRLKHFPSFPSFGTTSLFRNNILLLLKKIQP